MQIRSENVGLCRARPRHEAELGDGGARDDSPPVSPRSNALHTPEKVVSVPRTVNGDHRVRLLDIVGDDDNFALNRARKPEDFDLALPLEVQLCWESQQLVRSKRLVLVSIRLNQRSEPSNEPFVLRGRCLKSARHIADRTGRWAGRALSLPPLGPRRGARGSVASPCLRGRPVGEILTIRLLSDPPSDPWRGSGGIRWERSSVTVLTSGAGPRRSCHFSRS